MSGILLPFGLGVFFGGFIASMLYWKIPSFYKVVCGAFDSFYKKKSYNGKKKNDSGINLENWRK